jgi:type I restriction enzyme, S subunit
MSSEWRSGRLGDFIELKRGYDLPQSKRMVGPYPLVSSSGITDSHSVPMVRGPGVITGRYGTIGQVFFVEKDFWPLNTTLYVRDFKGNDPRYIGYFLKSVDFLAYSDKAAVPGVNRNHLHEAKAMVPDLRTQHEYAAILGALDDRITLLRETNSTLDAIAQALFKSWFLDFDPVRAKQEGRIAEGMDEVTAALFPDCFVRSVLGKVPSGWTADTLKNRTSNVQYGFTQSATTQPIGPHFLRITDIRDSKVDWQSVPFCAASDAEAKKYRVEDGDIFIARTGASTGESIYIVDPPVAVFASYLIRLQFSSPGIGRIVGEFVRTSAYKNYVSGTISGSAQPNANAQTLAAASMVFPPEEIASAFYERIRPLDLKKAANSSMAETLANLRDTLLPRLISGQLRLPGAVDESVELLTGS